MYHCSSFDVLDLNTISCVEQGGNHDCFQVESLGRELECPWPEWKDIDQSRIQRQSGYHEIDGQEIYYSIMLPKDLSKVQEVLFHMFGEIDKIT